MRDFKYLPDSKTVSALCFHHSSFKELMAASRSLSSCVLFCLEACLHLSAQQGTVGNAATPPPSVPDRAAIATNYGKLPLSFEANQGQVDSQVRFLSRGNGYSLFLTGQNAVLFLGKPIAEGKRSALLSEKRTQNQSGSFATDVVRMSFAGANPNASVSGMDKLAGSANYFIGNDPAKWHRAVPTYGKVKYQNLYPGIDLVYYGNQKQLEYDLIVAPNADPKPVRVQFDRAKKLKLQPNGDLEVIAHNGQVAFHKPVIYQEISGQRRYVEGAFTLQRNNTVGFRVGEYNSAFPLVIDPVLVYSTYLGGSLEDAAQAMTIDSSGDAYVAGLSYSSDFPVTKGAFQTGDDKSNTALTAFVAKLNSTGTGLIYATYLGGSTSDEANAIAVDSGGNAYIAGQTESVDFPTTSGSFQSTNPNGGGNYTAFVSKLNSAGTELTYSTYLGGTNPNEYSNAEPALGIAVNSTGQAYVVGITVSSDFPVTSGAFQTSISNFDGAAFVAELNATGTGLIYATFLGGSPGGSQANAVAVDASGNAYTVGFTGSSSFPVTSGAVQTTMPGPAAFVTELNPTGTALIYSTFLGGSSGSIYSDQANAIAVNGSGEAYVTGQTYSSSFPVTKNAFQSTNESGSSLGTGFVSLLNSTGTSLIYSTYLGGNYLTDPYGIQVDSSGDAYVAGNTQSTNFPVTTGAFQVTNPTTSSFGTGFVTKLNPTGTALLYSSYFGGNNGEIVHGIALDASQNVYVAGVTASTNFPVTAGAFQTTNHASYVSTGFVSKLDLNGSTTKIATTTTLTSSPNPQVVSKLVVFDIAVKPESGDGVPTGLITSTVDGAAGPTLTLSGGAATFSSDALAVGSHTIVATYGGDSNYTGSSSASLIQTISGVSSTATPVFTPVPGTYSTTQLVKITDATSGATIYYTTNGTTPTTASTKYTTAITVSATETIKAIAVATGYTNSSVATATYTISTGATTVATPTFSVVAGTYTVAKNVSVYDSTTGATIYYTLNGSTPTTSSTKYTGAIAVTNSETIKAIAVKAGDTNSAVASAAYVIETAVATPTFSVAAGTYTTSKNVSIYDATSGATIYYTLNGTTPTTASTKYTGAVAVTKSETIKAIAVKTGYTNSTVASAAYVIETAAATPTFSVAAGTYTTTKNVSIYDATSGATIYYTLNGTTPTTASSKYAGAIAVTKSETIKAVAVAASYTTSAVAAASYIINP